MSSNTTRALALAFVASALAVAAGCGSSEDSGLNGSGASGCYSTCRDDGGEPDACLAQCEAANSSGGATSVGGATGSGGSGNAGSGTGGAAQGGSAQGGSAQGGSAQGGSAQGGSAQGGSAQGGSAQGGSANGCSGGCPDLQGQLPGCCAASNACGWDFGTGCVEANQPGTDDGQCPGAQTQDGQTLPGCCRPDGNCGFLVQGVFGCALQTDFGAPPPNDTCQP